MTQLADRQLLAAIHAFVTASRLPDIDRFRAGVLDWGNAWLEVVPQHLPAADTLASIPPTATAETRPLIAAFARHRRTRKWEQSYTKADRLVGDDMLASYGFAEVIGKWGPFVSDKVRSGVGIYGANILYPRHHHAAEEIYVCLAGTAEFFLGGDDDTSTVTPGPGDAVYVPSRLPHGFRTREEPFVVFYIWQSGDLRETSTFG